MTILYLFISICFAGWIPSNYINKGDPRNTVSYCATAEGGKCTSCDNGFELVGESCEFKSTTNCPNTVYATHYETGNKCSYCRHGEEYDAGCKCKNNMGTDCKTCVSENDEGACDACVYGMALYESGCVEIDSLRHIDNLNEGNCIYLKYDGYEVTCDKCFGNKEIDYSGACSEDVAKITNCIYQIGSDCNACKDGYFFNGIYCDAAPEHCLTVKNKICTECLEGYVLIGDACHVCQIDIPSETGDECSIYSNTNCTACNKYCKVDVEAGVCVKNHCDLFGSGGAGGNVGECVRCENGYFLVGGSCIENMFEGFTSSNKIACLPGYYLEIEEGTLKKRCSHCAGPFIECISNTIPVPGKINLRITHLTTPTPCKNSFCSLCSDDDSYCFKCESPGVFVGGRCLINDVIEVCSIINADKFMACRVRGYDGFDELLSAFNISGSTNAYCFPQKTYLPYYFKVESSVVTCAGLNRNIDNDCDCNSGFISTSADKTTACSEITLESCEETANNAICLKCPIGAHIISEGKGKGECKCPLSQYPLNGKCVECPPKCISCELDSGNVRCIKCYETNKDILVTRDVNNLCSCLNSSFEEGPEVSRPYYSCALVNERCDANGKDVSYTISEGYWKCSVCDDPAYIPSSAYFANFDCTECSQSAYRNDSGHCVSCSTIQPGCSACNATTCYECLDSRMDVASNCATCTTTDFYVDPSDKTKCTQCPTKCNGCYCDEIEKYVKCYKCSYCQDDYCNPTKGECSNCTLSYYLNETNNECVSCSSLDSNCEKCSTTSSTCEICKAGYNLKDKNQCKPCSENSNCLRCNPTNMECFVCDDGYYLNSSLLCSKCSTNCLKCLNSTTCISCSKGVLYNYGCVEKKCDFSTSTNDTSCNGYCYDVITDKPDCQFNQATEQCNGTLNDVKKCIKCNNGYLLTNDNTCTYIDNCKYSTFDTCYVTEYGYYFNYSSKQTVECNGALINSQLCGYIESDLVVISCFKGFYQKKINETHIECVQGNGHCISYSFSFCIECESHYFLKDGLCEQCDDLCSECVSNPTNCTFCDTTKYYKVNNTCLLLNNGIGSCLKACEKTSHCELCPMGYFLNEFNECVNTKLKDCSLRNDERCLRCDNNSYLKNGECGSCSGGKSLKSKNVKKNSLCQIFDFLFSLCQSFLLKRSQLLFLPPF